MSISRQRKSVPTIPSTVKEFCLVCGKPYPDLSCTCGDKFHLGCIGEHAQQIDFEFEYIQGKVTERLSSIETLLQDENCQKAKMTVENWKRERLQEINDIADDAFNQIAKRETVYDNFTLLRAHYNELSQEGNHVVHQQLNSLVNLQGKVREISDELEVLPKLVHDYVDLDAALQSKLNAPIISSIRQTSSSLNTINEDSGIHLKIESLSSSSPNDSTLELVTNTLPVISTDQFHLNSNSCSHTKQTVSTLSTTKSIEDSFTTTEQIISQSMFATNQNSMFNADQIISTQTSVSISESTTGSEPLVFAPVVSVDKSPRDNVIESPGELSNTANTNNPTENDANLEVLDTGETDRILCRNIIRIPVMNDKHVATIACHKNELFYNDYNSRTRKSRLTFIKDLTQPTEKQIINWPESDARIGGGDDDWIQDITYCNQLKGYLLLNRSRLRLFHDDTHKIEEFYRFPDRSMKRVACNALFIYLIVAGGITSHHGDEIILMDYQKEEKAVKTFRDIIIRRHSRSSGTLVGEISDIAVNDHGHIIFTYRCERQQEVGICIYHLSKDGLKWNNIKSLLLNDCWNADLSYTPRIEWCEKLNNFILIEFFTSHLILLDSTGQVKGERLFLSGDNGLDSPLNLNVSNHDFLCIRYESFINIHRLT